MKGILKSISGTRVESHRERGVFGRFDVGDRIEVVILIDKASAVEIDKLKNDVGRGYYVVSPVQEEE